MKCVVCVKRVPDTATRIKIAADGMSLDPTDVEYILNPYDEFAVEEAIVRRGDDGEAVVVSLGPPETTKEIRTALAMGCDRGILIRSPHTGNDPFCTATVLAGVIRPIAPDLVFFGIQAVDDDGAQVGPIVAELLGLPCATFVTKLEIAGGVARAEREVEGGHETIEMPLPAVITCQKDLNKPRYASLPGIMKAKKKPIEEVDPALPEPTVERLSMALPPERPEGRIVGEGPDAVPALLEILTHEAKVL